MTLCAAWIRTVGRSKELVVASDSRLTGGIRWDGCPKIMTFSRSDFVICFAGNTVDAYPFMIQISKSIENHFKAASRALDIVEFSSHLRNVFNGMRRQVSLESDKPDVKFIIAGYSWRKKRFQIYTMELLPDKNTFIIQSHPKFVFIGDKISVANKMLEDRLWKNGKLTVPSSPSSPQTAPPTQLSELGVKVRFLRLLQKQSYSLLRRSGKNYRQSRKAQQKAYWQIRNLKPLLNKTRLDFEPFEVLRDIIKQEICEHIGGPPQLVKIYEYMNCIPYAIYWPNAASGQVTLFGRNLLSYEKTRYIVLDPETLITYEPKRELVPRNKPHE